MRAAIVRDPLEGVIVDAPVPVPAAGEVRLRLEGSGVCGSDLAVWRGRPWFDYPREPGAPGHEAWGVVDAVGPGVESPVEGERVTALCYRAYAEYDLADARTAVALPAELDGRPFPGEPLACAINVVRRSGIGPGMRVAVVGIGFLGALIVQLAAGAGAEVIAVSRRAFALDVARLMGAAHTLPLRASAASRVEELTEGRLCEVVVEAAGTQETLDAAGALTAVRGRLVIAGFHQDGPRTVDLALWNWRGLDVVNAHERDPAAYVDGLREAVAAVRDGRLDPFPLFTHHVPLTDFAAALRTADERPEGFLKALVMV